MRSVFVNPERWSDCSVPVVVCCIVAPSVSESLLLLSYSACRNLDRPKRPLAVGKGVLQITGGQGDWHSRFRPSQKERADRLCQS